jgi:hypothetical protein
MTNNKLICPECKSDNVAKILWGYPVHSEELQEILDSEEMVLGGCVIYENPPPDYRYMECNHEFWEE